MAAVEFAWAIGGTASAGVHRVGSCGSEAVAGGDVDAGDEGPVLGDVDVDVGGDVELSYNGFPGGVFPLGPFEFAAPTVAYPVGEYRGALTSPGGEGT